MDLENKNSRQRLDEIQNLLRNRVQLTEYYNFGRIEPDQQTHARELTGSTS